MVKLFLLVACDGSISMNYLCEWPNSNQCVPRSRRMSRRNCQILTPTWRRLDRQTTNIDHFLRDFHTHNLVKYRVNYAIRGGIISQFHPAFGNHSHWLGQLRHRLNDDIIHKLPALYVTMDYHSFSSMDFRAISSDWARPRGRMSSVYATSSGQSHQRMAQYWNCSSRLCDCGN